MEVLCFAVGMVAGLIVNRRRGEPGIPHKSAAETGSEEEQAYMLRMQQQLNFMQKYNGMPQEDENEG